MDTLKKFIRYVIAGIFLFIFVTFASQMLVKQTYQDIAYTIETSSPKIIIEEAKSTLINGYITGRVNNSTLGYINETNLKVDLYGKTDTHLGTKYLDLGNFKQNETKEFYLNFDVNRVSSCKVSLSKEGYVPEELPKMTEQDRLKVFGIGLITLIVLNAFF